MQKIWKKSIRRMNQLACKKKKAILDFVIQQRLAALAANHAFFQAAPVYCKPASASF
jgi:hypothetical protein